MRKSCTQNIDRRINFLFEVRGTKASPLPSLGRAPFPSGGLKRMGQGENEIAAGAIQTGAMDPVVDVAEVLGGQGDG